MASQPETMVHRWVDEVLNQGQLGVIEEGAYADILLINGEPLQDITLLEHPEVALALIMKDGRIYKNQLSSAGPAH